MIQAECWSNYNAQVIRMSPGTDLHLKRLLSSAGLSMVQVFLHIKKKAFIVMK
jgi:hypothetical protein